MQSAATTRFDTAVFIDLENLLKGYALSEEQMSRLDLSAIMEQIKDREALVGGFAIARAYANWQSYKTAPLQRILSDLGIAQEHVQAVSGIQKNLCDIALATDVMDVLHSRPHLRTFVIISGDGGFAWLVRRLHEYGKAVVIASYPGQMNEALRSLADAYISIEDPQGVRQADYHSADPLARALLDDVGRIYPGRSSQGEVEAFARRLFARMPELEPLRRALAEGVPMGKLQTWVGEVMDGFRHEAYGFSTFSEWVKPMVEGKHWELVSKGGDKLLYFRDRPQVIVPTIVERVELGDLYEGKATGVDRRPAAIPVPTANSVKSTSGNTASKLAPPLEELMTRTAKELTLMDKEPEFDFGEGVELSMVAKHLEERLPQARPFALGLLGFDHLAAYAAPRAELAYYTPNASYDKPLLAYQDQTIRGHRQGEPSPLAELHSPTHYKAVLAKDKQKVEGITFPYYNIYSPELTRATAEVLSEQRTQRLAVAEWKRILQEKLGSAPEFANLGRNWEKITENLVLAFVAAECFDRQPKNKFLQDQTLMLQPDLMSASGVMDRLRQRCALKIGKLIGVEVRQDVLKAVTG